MKRIVRFKNGDRRSIVKQLIETFPPIDPGTGLPPGVTPNPTPCSTRCCNCCTCCINVPYQLHFTITVAGGLCSCSCLDGIDITLYWDEDQDVWYGDDGVYWWGMLSCGRPAATGTFYPDGDGCADPLCCSFVFGCLPATPSRIVFLACNTGLGFPGCGFSCTCVPFQLTYVCCNCNMSACGCAPCNPGVDDCNPCTVIISVSE